jgi:hypothetical protein
LKRCREKSFHPFTVQVGTVFLIGAEDVLIQPFLQKIHNFKGDGDFILPYCSWILNVLLINSDNFKNESLVVSSQSDSAIESWVTGS